MARELGVRLVPRCTRCGGSDDLRLYRSARQVFPVRLSGELGSARTEITGAYDEIVCGCGHAWRTGSYRPIEGEPK